MLLRRSNTSAKPTYSTVTGAKNGQVEGAAGTKAWWEEGGESWDGAIRKQTAARNKDIKTKGQCTRKSGSKRRSEVRKRRAKGSELNQNRSNHCHCRSPNQTSEHYPHLPHPRSWQWPQTFSSRPPRLWCRSYHWHSGNHRLCHC